MPMIPDLKTPRPWSALVLGITALFAGAPAMAQTDTAAEAAAEATAEDAAAAGEEAEAAVETATAEIPRGEPSYAITAFGLEPLYPEDFSNWAYVNPEAPRGGTLRASSYGSFDTLNRFTLRGESADGLQLIDSSLGVGSADESSVYYGSVVESYEVAEDRTWLILNLRHDAYFHDHVPITAEDVIFTYDALINHAHPGYRLQVYAEVESYEALDDYTVRVTFRDGTDPEAILGAAASPVLPAHYWADRTFDSLTVDPPLGSGPYRIAAVDPGRWIEYEYVPDWWGADLSQFQGMYNFERIRYEYFRDDTVRYEALKAGAFDYIGVTSPQQWSLGFDDVPAVDDGRLILNEIPYDGPESYAAISFNIRTPPFDDVRVRRAVSELFDFETANRVLLFGLYNRNTSLFQNSEFAAQGLPTEGEMELLEPLRDELPEEVFGEAYLPPVTDGTGRNRAQLRSSIELLAEAGYHLVDGRMVNDETGEPLTFEVIYASPVVEPVLLHYRDGLRRAGIEMVLRSLQGAQWINAYNDRQYDALVGFLSALYPPGRELRDFFSSGTADVEGSQNAAGIADPALDALIDAVISSQTWDDRIAAARAFDRYHRLLTLSVPLYYDPAVRIAQWDVFGTPETRPRFGFSITGMWWHDITNTAAQFENR
ncbi:MAG: ABC transporter substrate-binding protein [Rhodospirillaceae bacterium]|nr:ABC transporter substrate-binding protein [Rhodospirillaceae bacterium]